MKHPSHALRIAAALRCVIALLLALNAFAPAQENAPPAPAAADTPAAAPQSEMQKWIAATDAQWQAVYQRDVTDIHEAEAKKLMLQYLNLLEEAIVKVSKAGDLDGAVALRSEQKRFGDTQLFPEQDEPGDPAAVKQARAAIRALLAQAAKNSAVRAKALHAKYDQVLAQAQAQLTQAQRLDDALLVKKQRDEVAAAWLGGIPAPAQAAAATPPAVGKTKPAATPKPAIGLATQGTRRITFRATVDAGDNVVVQNGKLHIEHIDWQKPKDISVNGVKWEPSWQDKTSDEFAKFSPALAPFTGTRVQVRFTQKGKKNGSVKVLDQPTEANGQKLVVHLQDEGGGASDFEVHITW
jgi:hypothetical protein